MWSDFQRKPKKQFYESVICVVKGQEEFRVVSPIFRKNIYVGVNETLAKYETPINFFNPNVKKYPWTRVVNFLGATLNAGDCMYVPAYYYVQSKTTFQGGNKESIIITQQFEAHSEMVDIMMDALES